MSPVRVALQTLGCRVNQADTIALADALRSRSATLVDSSEIADIYVLNTCTVTHAADADARKIARRMKRLNPSAQVVVTGCYAQVAPDALTALPEIDLEVGNDGKHGLADQLLGLHPTQQGDAHGATTHGAATQEAPGAATDVAPRGRRGRSWPARVRPASSRITALPETHTRPFLKVQDGCDYTCAFCIIPKARGVSRSFSVDDVARQAARYAELGAVELVLTGIHLGHWGRDLIPRVPFHVMLAQLADRLAREGQVRRIRLGSVEPNEVTPELIALVVEHPLLVEHLHVPLQSGDDDVLKRMRRLYSTDQYARVLTDLRAALPTAALGADVLVGHPGEDAASFKRTLALLDDLDWTYLHVFPSSARKGTPSAAMPDHVSNAAKGERVQTLVRRSEVRRHLFHRRAVGREQEWLVMKPAGDGFNALSRTYIPARINSDTRLRTGDLVRASAHDAGPGHMQVQL